ncbi:molybdopterin-dependent oxidoreductase [Herpetosiphon gulosus]|uniref:Oxidoreductase molybdopterin-binding domain-containing protein n=1 Tax=Herpetosiphon gulosus TaxID=1973496 RepID=A0ABP9WXQ7_9CHLR
MGRAFHTGFRLLMVTMVVLGSLVACGETTIDPASTYKVITPASIKAGEAIPAPSSEVILSLSGLIGQTNNAQQLDFSMDTLEQLGVVEYTLEDPFLGRTVTYQGVLISSIFEAAKVAEGAKTVKAVALNDYSIDIPIDELRTMPVILATRLDGERMAVADKGPLEIVFPYHAYKLEHEKYVGMWIWQLRSMEIK